MTNSQSKMYEITESLKPIRSEDSQQCLRIERRDSRSVC